MKSQKLFILDSLRGLIALFVVSYHFINFENHLGRLVPENETLHSVINPILEGSVSAFFIISALVIYLHLERYNYDLRSAGTFFLKRILRLHIPIIACILSIIIVNNGFNIYLGNPIEFSLSQFFSNLTLTAPLFDLEWYNPILWTLSVEFQFYFFIALVFPVLKRSPFVFLTLTSLVFLPFNYFFETEAIVTFYGPYFILGIALYLIREQKMTMVQFAALAAICCTDLFLNHATLYPVIPLLVIPVIMYTKKRFHFMEWIGNLSYSFYLMHGLFGGWFLYFVGRHAHSALAKIGVIILAMVVSFVGSYVFYWIVEKPSHRLSSRFKYSQHAGKK